MPFYGVPFSALLTLLLWVAVMLKLLVKNWVVFYLELSTSDPAFIRDAPS